MILPAKTEYACLAGLELALQHESGRPVRVALIAQRHGIPPQFLVQILSRLRAAGLVASTRGPAGGYRLSRAPQDITLADVIEAMEGPEAMAASAPASPLSGVLLDVVESAAGAMRGRLEEVSLAELIDTADVSPQAMYYI